VQFARKGAGAHQLKGTVGVTRRRGIIDEQHDAPVRMFDKRCGHERLPDHLGLFHVRRDENQHRAHVLGGILHVRPLRNFGLGLTAEKPVPATEISKIADKHEKNRYAKKGDE